MYNLSICILYIIYVYIHNSIKKYHQKQPVPSNKSIVKYARPLHEKLLKLHKTTKQGLGIT